MISTLSWIWYAVSMPSFSGYSENEIKDALLFIFYVFTLVDITLFTSGVLLLRKH